MKGSDQNNVKWYYRCFHYATMERGPVQLNIPRDMFYGDVNTTIPEPMNIERSAGTSIYL